MSDYHRRVEMFLNTSGPPVIWTAGISPAFPTTTAGNAGYSLIRTIGAGRGNRTPGLLVPNQISTHAVTAIPHPDELTRLFAY